MISKADRTRVGNDLGSNRGHWQTGDVGRRKAQLADRQASHGAKRRAEVSGAMDRRTGGRPAHGIEAERQRGRRVARLGLLHMGLRGAAGARARARARASVDTGIRRPTVFCFQPGTPARWEVATSAEYGAP